MVLGFLAQFNEYYPIPEKWMSQQELCTGVQTREPMPYFDGHRAVYQMKLNKNMIEMGDYCETDDFMRQQDPRFLYEKNDPDREQRVQERIVRYEDFAKTLVQDNYWYITRKIEGTRMFDHFWMGREMVSSLVYYFTSYSHMKQHCMARYPRTSE